MQIQGRGTIEKYLEKQISSNFIQFKRLINEPTKLVHWDSERVYDTH